MATETGEGSTGTSADEASSDSAGTEPSTGSATAETESEGFSQYQRSVIVTTSATLLGMAAGIASMLVATAEGPEPESLRGFGIVVAALFVQIPLYSVIGIDLDQFDTKGQLYVFAMTFMTWFITWSILLTTGGLL